MNRMQEHYVKNVVPQLQEKFQFSSAMQIPRITMISINMGLGEAVGNKKIIESAVLARRLTFVVIACTIFLIVW